MYVKHKYAMGSKLVEIMNVMCTLFYKLILHYVQCRFQNETHTCMIHLVDEMSVWLAF